MAACLLEWRGNKDWAQPPEDAAYFREHAVGG
jgi:hypothetical protein